MQNFLQLLLWINALFLVFSCKIFKPNLMLRTPLSYPYDTIPSITELYRIAPNDLVTIIFAPNKGYKVFEVSVSQLPHSGFVNITLPVEYDGTINLPLIGRVYLEGLTVREAENTLLQLLGVYFNEPYIRIQVSNRRVLIFPGGEGKAAVLTLDRDNMTLLEAIAKVGGIPPDGKAYKIKVIRGGLRNPQIYLFDLSKLSTAKNADFILQANDIIYVEPAFHIPRETLAQLNPILSLLTTITNLITFIFLIGKIK